MVDGARHAQRLIVDEMDLYTRSARIRGRAGDLGLEEFLQLDGSGGLARGRETLGGLAKNGGGHGGEGGT